MPDTKVCKKCGVDKALTEYHKDKHSKLGVRSYCKVCRVVEKREYYEANREQVIAQAIAWHRANPEQAAINARNKKQANPALYNSHTAKRRSAKLQRTASWADQDAIKAIYAEAQRLQEVLGIPMHVDHMVPLRGELVSGLHVESNLQVIPAALNLRKSNKFKVQ
jgi:hypothetical protein